jgi:hypothetical protein
MLKNGKDHTSRANSYQTDTEAPSAAERNRKAADSAPGSSSPSASPHGSSGGGRFFQPKRFGEFGGSEESIAFLVDRLIPQGKAVLFSAEAKAGKTTFLAILLKQLEQGGTFCGRTVQPCKVYYISEEDESTWEERIADLGLSPEHQGQCQPFLDRPTHTQWKQYVGEIVESAKANDVRLVIFDTLTFLWPAEDEDSNSEVPLCLGPLRQFTQQGITVLLVHHHGWGRKRARGASAFVGFPDVVIDLELYKPEDADDPRRQLKLRGRSKMLAKPFTIKLASDGCSYTVVGGGDATDEQPGAGNALAIMKQIAPENAPGWTVEDFLQHWPCEPKPKHQTLNNAKGKSGQPARYAKAGPVPPPDSGHRVERGEEDMTAPSP